MHTTTFTIIIYIFTQQLEESEVDLVVMPTTKATNTYTIKLPSLAAGKSVTVVVETIFVNAIKPFPESITQNEKQFVQFVGNVYVYTPYVSETQSTLVRVPSDKVESYTKISPASSSDGEIRYGPYSDVAANSVGKMTVHFENNGPFLAVTELVRVIEVSHWGNVAVEEHIHIRHIGESPLHACYSTTN